jgi:hypothetical protein
MGIQEEFMNKADEGTKKGIQTSCKIIRFAYGSITDAVMSQKEMGKTSLKQLLSEGKETSSLDPMEKDAFDILNEHLKKSGIKHSVETWKDKDGITFFRVTYLSKDRDVMNNALNDTMRDVADIAAGRKTRQSILRKLRSFVQTVSKNKEKEKDREHNMHQDHGAR